MFLPISSSRTRLARDDVEPERAAVESELIHRADDREVARERGGKHGTGGSASDLSANQIGPPNAEQHDLAELDLRRGSRVM